METGLAHQAHGGRSPHTELTQAVSAVAGQLGIAPATLRTWDHRYGLGPSHHAPGRHRRYAPHDVARLMLMIRGLRHGAAPAEAARYALQADEATLAALITEKNLATPPAGPSEPPISEFLPAASGPVGELARAAQALDTARMHHLVGSSIAACGVAHAWESVIRPVLGATGLRWAATGTGIEIEHGLSECVSSVLSRVMLETTTDPGEKFSAPAVLLACAPGETHSLPLRVLGAILAQQHVPVILLGGDIPAPALAAAVRRRQPAAVFLWAQMDRSADRHLFAQLPTCSYVLGGPAWTALSVSAQTQVVHTLADAEDALLTLTR